MPPEDHHINAEGYITIEKITASAVEEFYEAKEPGRRRAQINAPDRIDFWADAESGVGLHAEVQWADVRHLRFKLKESVPLSDQCYHYSEHAPEREVRCLPAKDRP